MLFLAFAPTPMMIKVGIHQNQIEKWTSFDQGILFLPDVVILHW